MRKMSLQKSFLLSKMMNFYFYDLQDLPSSNGEVGAGVGAGVGVVSVKNNAHCT